MEVQDFQSKIAALEEELAEKDTEIERLTTEQAVAKLKGMSHIPEQIEELNELRDKIKNLQEQLDEAQNEVERMGTLEEMLNSQQSTIQKLNSEIVSLKLSPPDEASENNEEIEQLRTRVQELEGICQSRLEAENSARDLYQQEVEKNTSLSADLHEQQEEIERLISDNEMLKENAASVEQEDELQRLQEKINSLHVELENEQQKNSNLSSMKAKIEDLEESVLTKQIEIDMLTAEVASINGREATGEQEHQQEESHAFVGQPVAPDQGRAVSSGTQKETQPKADMPKDKLDQLLPSDILSKWISK